MTAISSTTDNSKPSHRRKARQLLVQALYQWQMTDANVGSIEAEFFADNTMTKVDTGYFRELLHGIPAKLTELDDAFTPYLDRAREGLDPVSLAILRLGAFELLFRIDVPYKVVINEAVNLAKSFGPTEAHKYINSVLDKVALASRKIEINAGKAQS